MNKSLHHYGLNIVGSAIFVGSYVREFAVDAPTDPGMLLLFRILAPLIFALGDIQRFRLWEQTPLARYSLATVFASVSTASILWAFASPLWTVQLSGTVTYIAYVVLLFSMVTAGRTVKVKK